MGNWSSRSAKTRLKEDAVDDEAPLPAIHRDPNVMGGVPVFVGSRLPITTLLACVDAGNDWNRIVRSWPFVTLTHAEAARRYVAGYGHER